MISNFPYVVWVYECAAPNRFCRFLYGNRIFHSKFSLFLCRLVNQPIRENGMVLGMVNKNFIITTYHYLSYPDVLELVLVSYLFIRSIRNVGVRYLSKFQYVHLLLSPYSENLYEEFLPINLIPLFFMMQIIYLVVLWYFDGYFEVRYRKDDWERIQND